MCISSLYKDKRPLLSFEVFPPRPEQSIEVIYAALEHLKDLAPDFISVTYGAGGGNQERSLEIADKIKNVYGQKVVSHLTCVSSTPAKVEAYLHSLHQRGITDILALRGDIPKDTAAADAFLHYKSSLDLIKHIKKTGGFSIAVAAYPEVYYLADNTEDDIAFLKRKIDAGADMIITQMFFDNNAFFTFRDRMQKEKINVPISATIMPIFDVSQIVRMTSLCGCSIPAKLARMFAKYASASKEDIAKACVDYACEQINELVCSGVDGIHICTMNKYDQVTQIVRSLNLR
jgi:methylenetetrahydrofolate reductase (NADPH)